MPNEINRAIEQSSNQAIKQSSNQAIKQSSNQAIKQSSNQAIKQSSNQAIKQSSNQAIKQSSNQAIKQSSNYNLAPAPNQDNKYAKKASDGSIAGTVLVTCGGGGSVLVATPSRQGGALFEGENPQTEDTPESAPAARQWDVHSFVPAVEEVGPTPDMRKFGPLRFVSQIPGASGTDSDEIPQVSLNFSFNTDATEAGRGRVVITKGEDEPIVNVQLHQPADMNAPHVATWNDVIRAINEHADASDLVLVRTETIAGRATNPAHIITTIPGEANGLLSAGTVGNNEEADVPEIDIILEVGGFDPVVSVSDGTEERAISITAQIGTAWSAIRDAVNDDSVAGEIVSVVGATGGNFAGQIAAGDVGRRILDGGTNAQDYVPPRPSFLLPA